MSGHEHPSLMSRDHGTPGNGLLLFFRVDDFDLALQRARSLVTRLEEEPHVNPNTQTKELVPQMPGRPLVSSHQRVLHRLNYAHNSDELSLMTYSGSLLFQFGGPVGDDVQRQRARIRRGASDKALPVFGINVIYCMDEASKKRRPG